MSKNGKCRERVAHYVCNANELVIYSQPNQHP